VLRDNGRPPQYAAPNRPAGSVHGDSTGVHGSDSANAWCNQARAGNARNRVVCLLLGAWQVGRDRSVDRGADFLTWEPYPRAAAGAAVQNLDAAGLLRALDGAIRNRDQAGASAVVARYATLNAPVRPVLDVLLRYACSEDGALHMEKYYRTTTEEFAA